jgi:hypothetical protein
MPKPLSCPSEQDLQRLLLGQIPESEAERLEEPVDGSDNAPRCSLQ